MKGRQKDHAISKESKAKKGKAFGCSYGVNGPLSLLLNTYLLRLHHHIITIVCFLFCSSVQEAPDAIADLAPQAFSLHFLPFSREPTSLSTSSSSPNDPSALISCRTPSFRMGFPSFPNLSAGVFPILIINTALSIAAFRDALKSVLQFVGLSRNSTTDASPSLWMYPPEDPSISSGLVLPTMWDEIRSSLPVIQYDPVLHDNSSEDDAQCAVCLSDFESGVDIHQLPRCNHVFHQGCIDEWLDHQQTTCPLCRSSLVSEELTYRYRRREQELTEELILWFSNFHGSGLQGVW